MLRFPEMTKSSSAAEQLRKVIWEDFYGALTDPEGHIFVPMQRKRLKRIRTSLSTKGCMIEHAMSLVNNSQRGEVELGQKKSVHGRSKRQASAASSSYLFIPSS